MSNYSYGTSLPAFLGNQSEKEVQALQVYNVIINKKRTFLKEIEDTLGIPQSTVAARVNGLILEGKLNIVKKIHLRVD